MTEDSQPKPKLTYLQNGVAQVALIVENLEKTVENYWNTEETIGTAIELIERPKERLEPEKIYPPEEDESP